MKKKNQEKNQEKKERIVYYRDENNDEFSTAVITPIKIDGSYRYDRTTGWRGLARFFWYRIVAVPIAYFYLKIIHHHKIVNRKLLKEARKKGVFIYGNHTQIIGDALIPTFVRFPGDAFVIVHPNNVSMPYLGRINPYLGALPLPDDMEATRNFMAEIEKKIQQNKAIFIYPEAHIWPYYTKIRPFGDEAFLYPVKYNTPVYCFTNTYQKRRFSKKPRLVTYVDGPFYADEGRSARQKRKQLREDVYSCMCERSKLSTVEWIVYQKAEEEEKRP